MCTKYCIGCKHEGVASAIAESMYQAGVTAGWNAANSDDPKAALTRLTKYDGYLKPVIERSNQKRASAQGGGR